MTIRATDLHAARQQRGMSLLFAMMALVVISLAAVALVRSVDTGSLVIGNLGFKQDATVAAGEAAEQAITWIDANAGVTLQNNVAARGYYAASLTSLDVTGQGSSQKDRAVVDWDGNTCASYAAGVVCFQASPEIVLNGGTNRARYVITRLCSAVGAPATVDCAAPLGSALTSGGNMGAVDYKSGSLAVPVANLQYYRIVVRVLGPRGTAAFTETIVQR